MEKRTSFTIKKGIDCSWCVELMKKTLAQHFSIKKIDVDVINKKVNMALPKGIKSKNIMVFLKKRGYHLIEDN